MYTLKLHISAIHSLLFSIPGFVSITMLLYQHRTQMLSTDHVGWSPQSYRTLCENVSIQIWNLFEMGQIVKNTEIADVEPKRATVYCNITWSILLFCLRKMQLISSNWIRSKRRYRCFAHYLSLFQCDWNQLSQLGDRWPLPYLHFLSTSNMKRHFGPSL